MSTPTNQAAWHPAKNARKLEVKEAPYPQPLPNELVVKTAAVAINPVDWLIQQKGDLMFTWIKYPFIFGYDGSGTVVEIGSQVTRFKVGDRVTGFPCGTDPKINKSSESSFQKYMILQSQLAVHIPADMSFEQATVIPLGVSTAAAGLFEKDQLNLPLPVFPRKDLNKSIIIWGGSTSVGCNAIQLAVAAGYTVITTCSPKNNELVKSLGASYAFDYNSKTVVKDIKSILSTLNKPLVGALSIGRGGAEACMDIMACPESNCENKFVAMATYPEPKETPTSFVLLKNAATFVSWMAAFKAKGLFTGVKSNFIFSSSVSHNGVGRAIWEEYLPKALSEGTFKASPEPVIFGKGLDKIQDAMEFQKKGVSAKKVVVQL